MRSDTVNHHSDLPEMLTSYALVHDAMARDAGRLVVTLDQDSHAIDGAHLRRWFAHFTAEIAHHHQREDDLVFPALVERAPDFSVDLDVLEADHHALDGAMAETRTALARFGSEATSRAVAAQSARSLTMLLTAHLEREEDATFGRIAAHFSPDEYATLEAQMLRSTPRKLLAFEAPFVLDHLDRETRRDRLATVPAAARLLYRIAFVPAYRRLDAALVSA